MALSRCTNTVDTVAKSTDLECVIDAQNGEALGTQEYRYNLQVIVIVIGTSEKWTSAAKDIEISGRKAFGLISDPEHKPLVNFNLTQSVIDELDGLS